MKELIENKVSTIYIDEFSLEKNIKLKSLIIMYLIMTRSDAYIDELFNILLNILKNDKKFRTNNDEYMNIIIKFSLSKGISCTDIINNYIKNGYLYHSTNGAFFESIKNQGLIYKNKPWDIEELENIRNIFINKGKNDVFGLYQGMEKTPIYLSSNILYSSYYSVSSPTWFLHFVTGGMQNKEADKEAYRNRDYNACLKNVLNLVKNYNLTEEESKKVLNFFNKYYNLLGLNSEPILLLIDRKKIINNIDILERTRNESDFEYLKRIFNTYCLNNIIVKNDIVTKDIIIINYFRPNLKQINK